MFQKLWRIHTNPFILDHIGPLHLPQAHHQLLLHQHQPPGDNSFSPKFSITISPLNWEFSSLSSDHVNSPLLGLSPKGDILPLHNHPILLHLVRGDLHLEGNLRDGTETLGVEDAHSDCTVAVRWWFATQSWTVCVYLIERFLLVWI